MIRAAASVLATLALLMAGSPSRAAVRECQRVSLRDFYAPTSDALVLHSCRETFIGAEGPKGSGKTQAVCADAIIQATRLPGWRGMMFRQKGSVLQTSTLPSFWKVCKPELANKIIADHTPTRGEIKFTNGSVLLYRGLSGSTLQSEPAIQQFLDDLKSTELCWWYINEASQTRKEFPDTLKQTLRHIPEGARPQDVVFRGIMDTNPEPGWFHKTFVRGPLPKDHRRIHFDPANNPGLAPGYYARFEDMPESWKAKYIRGEWVFSQEGDGWVYPLAMVDRAFELDLPADDDEESRYGLDPAGKGADHAALALQEGPRFTLWSWPLTTGPELTWNIEDVTRERGRATIHGDAGGLGAPILDTLEEGYLYRDKATVIRAHDIKRISTAKTARKPEKFADRRTEMFWTLRDRMAEGRASFAGAENALARLREQMLALQFEPDSAGRPKVEAKKVFKARTGMSPDELEAVVYACSSRSAWA